MAKEISEILVPINNSNFEDFDTSSPGNALFLFQRSPNEELSVFKTPFSFTEKHDLGIESFGDRMNNVGWYVRKYFERKNDLWGDFSRELIFLKINDKKGEIYEVSCCQTFATSATYGLSFRDSYFLKESDENSIKDAFHFSANRLLNKLNLNGFSEDAIGNLRDFFYEDFMTLKYATESKRIGQEADSVFF